MKNEQILIQPMVRNIVRAGVVFTADIDTYANYYIVNYSDNGDSTSVTSGDGSGLTTYIEYGESKLRTDDRVLVQLIDCCSMLKEMITQKGDYLVAVDDNWKEYWQMRYGKVDFDTENLSINNDYVITELGLDSPKLEDISARYVGLLKFSKKGLDTIISIMNKAYKDYWDKPWQQSGKIVQKAYMTDLLNALIENGNSVRAVRFNNGWIEFDTNEDYEKACAWIESGEISKVIKLYTGNE